MTDPQLPKDSLLMKMADLMKQAATEKSHYYVASVLGQAITRIEQLQMPPAKVLELAELHEGADTQAVLNALCGASKASASISPLFSRSLRNRTDDKHAE